AAVGAGRVADRVPGDAVVVVVPGVYHDLLAGECDRVVGGAACAGVVVDVGVAAPRAARVVHLTHAGAGRPVLDHAQRTGRCEADVRRPAGQTVRGAGDRADREPDDVTGVDR